MHTLLGYWNQAYHHGTWLQTTVFRPEIYRWEDDGGGLLPVHEVGVRARRRGLGRPGAPRVQREPHQRPGPDAGGGRHRPGSQRLEGGQPLARPEPDGSSWTAGGRDRRLRHHPSRSRRRCATTRSFGSGSSAASWSSTTRGSRCSPRPSASGTRTSLQAASWTTTGLYAQAAFTAGRLKPYYRYDYVDRSQDDPFFRPAMPGGEKHTLGLRVDPWSRLAVKLELAHDHPEPGPSFDAAFVQLAFTF